MAESKHQQLVNSICDAVVAALKPHFEQQKQETAAEFANVNALLGAAVARLEVLENSGAAGGGAKRAPRGERKTGGAAAKKPAAATDDPLDKVKNAMLFCRRMWADDEDFRTRYSSEATAAEIEADDKVTKHTEGSEERYLAEGSLVWRKCLTAQQKKDVRDEFNRWKDDREKQALEEPLATDGGDEDGADDE